MVRVRGAANEHAEPLGDVLGANGLIRRTPVGLTLRGERREHHVHGTIEILDDLVFGSPRRIAEFSWPVADISRSRDLRADVVVEIA
jgi:hypothetical protein